MSKQRRDEFVRSRSEGSKRPAAIPWNAIVIAAFIGLVVVAVLVMQRQSARAGGFASVGQGGDISFPLSEFADGNARFYNYTTSTGTHVRFFIMRSPDGVTRAAFDTCDECYRERRGYRQSGQSMICNNCEQSFPSASINDVRGGCNPAPLDRVIDGNRLVLRAAALEQGAFYF